MTHDTMRPRRHTLDVGCGRSKRAGAIGVDLFPVAGVDVVADADRPPLPFRDDTFDEVNASHIIEHVQSLPDFMGEIHRVARPGALVCIATPHFSWIASWTDPTHRWHLSTRTFMYFTEGHFSAHYTHARYRCVSLTVSMPRVWRRLGLQILLNLENRHRGFRFVRKFWEEYLAFIIRAKEMRAVLEVVKDPPGATDR
ncbi:MAG: class I SAM-dependent methyltransferase [Deltaproteobacteria bacterium]|nr:class I SAM-dependent methyltransferase [Deltaproteobacteria bacterium]MBI3387313.1 class I SAM-dependent methyltransferase [Deltaproteobacteria bacterium]